MESAAIALASGSTLDEAARQSGAGVTTVKRWVAELPAMRERGTELRAELSARVLARVASGMVTAIATLERLCARGKTETTQLKAAESLLTHGNAAVEIAELKSRIDTLEAAR
jgi:hypothetical protein